MRALWSDKPRVIKWHPNKRNKLFSEDDANWVWYTKKSTTCQQCQMWQATSSRMWTPEKRSSGSASKQWRRSTGVRQPIIEAIGEVGVKGIAKRGIRTSTDRVVSFAFLCLRCLRLRALPTLHLPAFVNICARICLHPPPWRGYEKCQPTG